ncbi:MAG TPA: Flp pilus assembly protein CpaB [Verrucomicrobiae bacterium]|nr:Flp pilus assembly protein CpaB [Verrucomicrobiae bacterium]
MNRRNIVIATVAILAIGLGLVVYAVLSSRPNTPPPRNVLTAAMRIPARAHITNEMVTVIQRPSDQVQADALANPGDAVGQIAQIDIPEGGIVTSSMLAKPTPPPTGLQVPDGMRAVTISIDQVKGVAGLLKPGDHVDVIAVPPRGASSPLAFTIMRDINVLAVGGTIAQSNSIVPAAPGQATPAPAPATTVTLSVTPDQADMLASADINATLRLALRSPKERANSLQPERLIYPTTLAKVLPTATPFSTHPGVIVINGDVAQP